MIEYKTHFIPQNIAPKDANRIICFDENGSRVGRIGLYELKQPYGEKLYCFGAISDVHLDNDYPTSTDDFTRALSYFKNKEVAFICVCGDCTGYGSYYDYQKWAEIRGNSGLTLYEVAGNHDATNAGIDNTQWKTCIGKELFYTVKQGDDLFIFLSMNIWDNVNHNAYNAFNMDDLQKLETALNNNKNKRIFLFQHCFYWEGSGNPNQSYDYDLMNGADGERFFSIIKNNTNVIWFHGHSHIIFETQEQYAISNYDNILGCHSIHIPSLTQPAHLVNGAREYISEGGTSTYSQGYVVDVYKNHIVLNGINFVTGEQLPIATYKIDTPLQTIEANTFTDTTGTITT